MVQYLEAFSVSKNPYTAIAAFFVLPNHCFCIHSPLRAVAENLSKERQKPPRQIPRRVQPVARDKPNSE
ncbi:hypothetical protein [Phormidium sp. CCY1219]|uniref:hypothetical protein n=1 Tax=Phormidium sp. CCY1219 TaxID=2886104 RepID=UPI002D1F0173|nr:hypothetical protein [Phormidium sp. CCY1219]MEB3828233.1 hypothetical protein [Phormidium sp. CCY1219]